MISRRRLLTGLGGGGLAAGLFGAKAAANEGAAEKPLSIRIDDLGPGAPINPFIYGSNEIGKMDGDGQSVDYDLKAHATIRRLGGDLLTGYNWLNNAAHAGKDWRHANGGFLLDILDVPRADWDQPGAVVERFLANSRKAGAPSLLTLQTAGFVAADFDGPVAEGESAPSRRFLAVDWSAPDKAIPGEVNMPALVARLVARHRSAANGGVRGYYLDNEPGLWTGAHPRIVTKPPTIRSMIERSLRAAAAIKAIDPTAWVLGPASWGASEFVDFQNAPDWAEYRSHGSFLGAFLDAFRLESERKGCRLLDMLDVHWYPFNRQGDLFLNKSPDLAGALLDAPRSLDEPNFCENSWVLDVLGCKKRDNLYLPLLPSLHATIDAHFPGTGLSIGEYHYGGPGFFPTSLAMADALGRFGRNDVAVATYWGALSGFVGEAFRLYRSPNQSGEPFGATSLAVSGAGGGDLSLFAARSQRGNIHLVALNKSARPLRFDLALASGRAARVQDCLGYDQSRPALGIVDEPRADATSFVLPPMSARRYAFA